MQIQQQTNFDKQVINFICMVSAFSVPKAKRQQKPSHNPGPGQYNHDTSPKVVKPTDPHYSFGKQCRDQFSSKVPGPGAYQQKNTFVRQKKPSYSIQGRKQNSPSKINVGPGQYDPAHRYSKQNSPSYSYQSIYIRIYGRSNSVMAGIKVGPGQYDIKGDLEKKKSGIIFTKDTRDNLEKKNVPGPGTYDYEGAVFKYGSRQDPSYGFGSRLKDLDSLNVPGPGSYQNKSAVYSKISGIMSRQMRGSYADSKTPGPGNYETDQNKVKSKDPSWSLSKSPRDQMSKSTMVGPGSYEYDKNYQNLVKTNSGYNFGSENKLKHDISKVPGPGHYESTLQKSKVGIKIANKLENPQGMKVPGPGSYENQKYDYQSWIKGSGKYSLGKSIRDNTDKRIVPGPGAYDSKQISNSGKVTFSKDKRLRADHNPNPGPGNYELKPFFADVPHYLLPNKSS